MEVNKEEQLINIYYPKSYDVNIGILPCVRLEIGPLAAWTPAKVMNINPYISNIVLPNFNVDGTRVRTVSIGRTFWEKITILHREANRPESKRMPKRYARHYYDVYQIFNSKYSDEILKDKEILKRVTEFKIKFYNDNWAKYDDVLNGNIRILPPEYRFRELYEDYDSMKEMINGEIPSFNEIIMSLKDLEKIINR